MTFKIVKMRWDKNIFVYKPFVNTQTTWRNPSAWGSFTQVGDDNPLDSLKPEPLPVSSSILQSFKIRLAVNERSQKVARVSFEPQTGAGIDRSVNRATASAVLQTHNWKSFYLKKRKSLKKTIGEVAIRRSASRVNGPFSSDTTELPALSSPE